MTERPTCRTESLIVLALCAAASLAGQVWSWRHGAMLDYGDAVAHLHIARRIFDSHCPGIEQFGSVWLPLPHLLMVPFVQVYAWWADGIAGAIPSALAYLASCVGIYRLARRWLAPAPAALALAFFALNPNLLYLQTTAMTESLFLCETVWIVFWLVEWRDSLDDDPRRAARLLWTIAVALVAAIFTRYDGWVLALLAWCGVAFVLARRGQLRSRSFWLASALVAAAPVAWFIYNAAAFGDWLYFARGPFSAKAIEMRTAVPGWPPHPGWHNPWVGLLFFLKVSEMDAAAAAWGNVVLALGVLGTAWAWLRTLPRALPGSQPETRRRAFAFALLLWLPVPFYAYSVAYGSVPIFIPPWWPHSLYNTRYGMELLPALALGLGFAAQLAVEFLQRLRPGRSRAVWPNAAYAVLFALVCLNAYAMLRERPLVYAEATKNAAARAPYDAQIPPVLRELLAARPGGIVLMNTSAYPELVAFTGIPLRQTINESDKRFFRAALAAPAAHAAIVVTFAGDEVDRAVKAHPEGLKAVQRFAAKGQPSATIYVRE
ncbi:MAG: glycosyltransferase family 39 protein [Terracidiphilus sp.]